MWRIVSIFVALSLLGVSVGLTACDSDDASEEGDETVVDDDEEQADGVVQEEEAEDEVVTANSSFTYRPFSLDEEFVDQEGHAMAFIEREDGELSRFRILIVPTHVEFVCGDPFMQQRGTYEEGEKSLTLIASEDFELEEGDHVIEFINVRNIGIGTDQDLRFDLQHISDDQIRGEVIHITEDEDEEPRITAEFEAGICETEKE